MKVYRYQRYTDGTGINGIPMAFLIRAGTEKSVSDNTETNNINKDDTRKDGIWIWISNIFQ